jgi:hypothetical protein
MMRWTTSLALVLLAATTPAAGGEAPRTFRLRRDALGKLPPDWQAAKTGQGEGSVWKVVTDDTAPSRTGLVLAQTAASPKVVFNLCVARDTRYNDVEVRAAFKAVRGKNDQGGGLVWRYRDANNYYVVRMNPLEDNYRLYKVVGGKRIQLATREGLKVSASEWHTLTVQMVGDHIECFLDGKRQLDVRDDTFRGPGQVGLWTKSDAQTYFDGFAATEIKR